MRSGMRMLLAVLMSVMLAAALAGCGGGAEPADKTAPEAGAETVDNSEAAENAESGGSDEVTIDTSEPEEGRTEYNIVSGLDVSVDGDMKTIETDHFKLTLPLADTWDCESYNYTSFTVYNIDSRNEIGGGVLMTILVFEPEDTDYEEFPNYSVIGESGGKVYVALYPTDVQYVYEDEKITSDYQTVSEVIEKIRTGGADSPLVLK